MASPALYQLRVRGELDQKWSAWFDGMSVEPGPGGTTLLTGPVPDQPAHYGHLNRARDLGLELLSLNRLPP